MSDNDFKIKIIVLGDPSSGKTSLVHLICNSEELKKSSYTIGCSVDVKIHQFKDGTREHKQCIVEFWDVGGSIKSCTDIFYANIDGCLLVHDLTNRRSYDNLINYFNNIEFFNQKNDSESVSFRQPPTMLIGTKLDQANEMKLKTHQKSLLALKYGFDEINLNCVDRNSLAAGQTNSVKLAKFFDKSVEYSQQKEKISKRNSKHERPSYTCVNLE